MSVIRPVVDSALIVRRKGTADDPYVSITEALDVLNGRVVLKEAPDSYSGVVISGFIETNENIVQQGKFRVDYTMGIIYFNTLDNGTNISIQYMGTGYILYPSSRIYVQKNGSPDVIETLQNVIDAGGIAINNLSLIQGKIDETNVAISGANTAKDSANTAATAANTATNSANTAATSANNAATAANTAKTNADAATTSANSAATAANTAKTNADTATASANTAATNAQAVADNTAHKGAWNSGTAYQKNNVITFGGSGYMALRSNTNKQPDTNALDWSLVSSKGDVGATGATGSQGIQGLKGSNWKGTYSASTQYAKDDVIFINGSSYICIAVPSVGTAPPNATYWDTVAVKGTDGSGAGTVTNVTSANADIGITSNATTPILTLNVGTGVNQIVKRDGTGKITDLASYATLIGATFTGAVIVDVGGGGFKLKPASTDHTYMEFYARTATPTTRTGYLGFGSAASIVITLINEITNGGINLISNGTGTVQVNGSAVWHAGNFTPANKLDTAGGALTGFLTVHADPTSAFHVASKQYVDSFVQGLDIKTSVRVATTVNIALSGTQTIDGVAVIAGNRVLVKNQTTGSQNGIYVVAAGAWTRATDVDVNAKVTSGMFTFVSEGTVNVSSGWVLTTPDPITVGTTSLTFVQFSGAGQIVNGNGILKNGNTLSVDFGTGSTQVSAGNHTHTPASLGAIASTEKGVANGIATLDATTKIPLAQISSTVSRTARVRSLFM